MNGISRLVLTLLIVGALYWFLIKPNLPTDFSFTPPPELKEVLRGVGHAPAPPPRQEVQAPKKKTTVAKKKVQTPKKKAPAQKKKPATPPAEEKKTVIVTKDVLPPSHVGDDNDDYRWDILSR